MCNFVMGLCSSPGIKHPVEATSSPFCHYTYSNLTKVVEYCELSDDRFLKFVRNYLPPADKLSTGETYRMLSHDLTRLEKPYSGTLPKRGYVMKSNPVAKNLSLTAGYYVPVLHAHDTHTEQTPVLMMEYLEADANKHEVIMRQIKTVMEHSDMPYKEMLTLFNADSAYGRSKFISALYEYENLVGILRLRSGIKLWTKANTDKPTGGAPRVYEEKYYTHEGERIRVDKKTKKNTIQKGIDTLPTDESDSYVSKMKNGREVEIKINRWNELLMRGKKGDKMKEKPLDLIQVTVTDTKTGKRVFDRPMFIAITGKKKDKVPSVDAQKSYKHRFDVEVGYRFMKQNLLLEKHQTCVNGHIAPWLNIVKLSYWLLHVAGKELAQIDIPPWQKYMPINKNNGNEVIKQGKVTLSQAQKSLYTLFCTFDPTPFLPQKCKKGKGRENGDTQVPRTRHQILKKSKL